MNITKEEIDAVPDYCGKDWEPMALAICHKIESMGASEELTALSVMASELYQSIATFNRYCDKQVDQMCAEHPDVAQILRPTCRECGIALTKENIVRYDATFAVCKRCETETAAEWQDTKKMLKEQGFDPDNCTFIEDVLAKN